MWTTATIYLRFRDGRRLDSVVPTQLSINSNLWDDKNEYVKTKVVCDDELRTHVNEEIRKLKTYIEKTYQQEKELIDKEWLKITVDKYHHPEKYFIPEEITIKPTIGELFDEFLKKHPLSEVRKKNFRVVKNHKTGKSCKLNAEDTSLMQDIVAGALGMERRKSKAETGSEHLERGDYIVAKQKGEAEQAKAEAENKENEQRNAELDRRKETAQQQLRQVKAKINTQKMKGAAVNATTAIADSVSSLLEGSKVKRQEAETDS